VYNGRTTDEQIISTSVAILETANFGRLGSLFSRSTNCNRLQKKSLQNGCAYQAFDIFLLHVTHSFRCLSA
jgi:hypothetical protein